MLAGIEGTAVGQYERMCEVAAYFCISLSIFKINLSFDFWLLLLYLLGRLIASQLLDTNGGSLLWKLLDGWRHFEGSLGLSLICFVKYAMNWAERSSARGGIYVPVFLDVDRVDGFPFGIQMIQFHDMKMMYNFPIFRHSFFSVACPSRQAPLGIAYHKRRHPQLHILPLLSGLFWAHL